MTAAGLQAWQERNFGSSYGAQVQAAAALGVPRQTYRNWLTGRRSVPDTAARLCQYVERHGSLSEEA